MSGNVRGVLWGAACVLLAVEVARVAVSPIGLSSPVALALVGAPLLVLVSTRPAMSLWIGAAIPFLIPLLGSSVYFGLGIGLLAWGIALSWSTASTEQKRFALGLTFLGIATAAGATLINEPGPSTVQYAIGVVYTCVAGANACVTRPGPRVLLVLLQVMGAAASLLASSTLQSVDRNIAVMGENANGVGLMCAVGLVAALASISANPKLTGLWVLVALVCAQGVLASGSRGAVLAAGCGAAMWAVGPYVARGRRQAITAVVVLGSTAFYAALPILEKFAVAEGRSVTGIELNLDDRLGGLRYALMTGMDHPIFGVGLGRLNVVAERDVNSGLSIRAHNVYAGVFAESGLFIVLLLGLLLLVAADRAIITGSRTMLPVLSVILIGGISLEWWGTPRLGVVALVVVAVCATATAPTAGRRTDPDRRRGRLGWRDPLSSKGVT